MRQANDLSDRVRLRTAVYVENEGAILLVHDPVYRGGCWTLPGGGVEFDEQIAKGAEREVYEETGITVSVHSLWHIREIWEPEPDCLDQLPSIRKTLELVLFADYVSGNITVKNDPSHKADGIKRVSECRWFSEKELKAMAEKTPIYPTELLDKVNATTIGIASNRVFFPPLDLRGQE